MSNTSSYRNCNSKEMIKYQSIAWIQTNWNQCVFKRSYMIKDRVSERHSSFEVDHCHKQVFDSCETIELQSTGGQVADEIQANLNE